MFSRSLEMEWSYIRLDKYIKSYFLDLGEVDFVEELLHLNVYSHELHVESHELDYSCLLIVRNVLLKHSKNFL
jgi:hypothetical protein